MAIAEIELPDGRVVELEVPDGTSETQIMQWIQQNPRALESAPKAAPADTGMGMSEMLGLTTRALKTAIPIDAVGDFVAGTASGMASIPEGIRQGYNKLTGDEAELASLNADYEKRRNMLKELTGDSTAASVGEFTGQVGPYLLGGALAAPTRATSVVPMTARAAAGGAIGGAAGGYAQALTPEQEDAGQRESGALVGGVLGGAIPALAGPINRGVQNAKEIAGRRLPRQALYDFLTRSAGLTDDTTQSVVDTLRGKVKNRTAELQGELGALYDAEKNIPGLPKVSLDESAKYDPNRTISEILGGYGIGKRVSQKNQQGALQQFVDPQTGKITYGPAARDFGDVRQYLSYLKKQFSELKDKKGEQANILKRVIERNEEDLADWANQTPEARQAMDDALALDKRYAQEVVPLLDSASGRPVAQWRDAAYGEDALDQIFMGQRAGTELRDLTTRVPGSEEELKKYLALQLRNMAGREPARLGDSTTTEALFSSPERDYMKVVKQAIEKEADDTGIAHNLAQLVGRVSGGFPEKLRYGVQPYGTSPAAKTDLGALATALRAAGLLKYNSGE